MNWLKQRKQEEPFQLKEGALLPLESSIGSVLSK